MAVLAPENIMIRRRREAKPLGTDVGIGADIPPGGRPELVLAREGPLVQSLRLQVVLGVVLGPRLRLRG